MREHPALLILLPAFFSSIIGHLDLVWHMPKVQYQIKSNQADNNNSDIAVLDPIEL
jgi:hypothetical protein